MDSLVSIRNLVKTYTRGAQKVDARARCEQTPRVDMIHPIDVGRNEEVRGRSRLDLLRECVACAVRHDDLVPARRLEASRLLVHRLFKARCGEHSDFGGRGGHREQRAEHDPKQHRRTNSHHRSSASTL